MLNSANNKNSGLGNSIFRVILEPGAKGYTVSFVQLFRLDSQGTLGL